jgi:hypothetical protein
VTANDHTAADDEARELREGYQAEDDARDAEADDL